jgi:hypothetical protein
LRRDSRPKWSLPHDGDRIDFVADFNEVAGGYGGYNADHEFFGYRQSI